MINEVSVQVPATTANLGPGYDCLGVSLRLSNISTLRRKGPPSSHPMVAEAARLFFAEAGARPFSFAHEIKGAVPVSRGLGSSVTLRLGVLMGLNALCGTPLDIQDLFTLCSKLEGHPDNAAPAVFGGFTVAHEHGAIRFSVRATLAFVLFVPDFEVRTTAARRVLPATVRRVEAALSAGNACRITAAFASKDYEALRDAFGDALHQPYRRRLVPMLDAVISAGVKAGALGGFLSGSGSTIACVTTHAPDRVAAAMKAAGGCPGARTLVAQADNRGARILGSS